MLLVLPLRRPHPRAVPPSRKLLKLPPELPKLPKLPKLPERATWAVAAARARRGVGIALGMLVLAACGRARHPGQVPNSPQAALDAALIQHKHKGTRRTRDGGILYTAELIPGSPEALRVPFDLLKLECENHAGSFGIVAAPERSAASLASTDTPDPIYAQLQDADRRNLFGQHRCSAGSNAWTAEIEPVALQDVRGGRRFQLQMYVRASPDDGYDPGAPPGPGLPALAAARAQSQPPSAAEGPTPSAPPAATQQPRAAAPLDPQPPRPPLTGDRLLADPHPFGITPGVDSPAVLAKKLDIELTRASACDRANLQGLCWDQPSAEASALRAAFADLGAGPVLAELEVRYPASAHAWLLRTFTNQFGAPDNTDEHMSRWSWLHTLITLTSSDTETRVNVTDKPTLDRAQLPVGNAAREPVIAGRAASPWQLQLGYEPAQTAQSKLKAAGFSIAETGCADGGPYAHPVFTRTCPLRGGNMRGLRGAWVRSVDIGDGHPRLAELGYTLDKSALDQTSRDLKQQYGEPIPSEGGQLQWWTGPVGVTLTPSSDTFTLRYYHGRLLQYFIVAEEKRQAADKAIQRQGL